MVWQPNAKFLIAELAPFPEEFMASKADNHTDRWSSVHPRILRGPQMIVRRLHPAVCKSCCIFLAAARFRPLLPSRVLLDRIHLPAIGIHSGRMHFCLALLLALPAAGFPITHSSAPQPDCTPLQLLPWPHYPGSNAPTAISARQRYLLPVLSEPRSLVCSYLAERSNRRHFLLALIAFATNVGTI
jgi:hypothetical protein